MLALPLTLSFLIHAAAAAAGCRQYIGYATVRLPMTVTQRKAAAAAGQFVWKPTAPTLHDDGAQKDNGDGEYDPRQKNGEYCRQTVTGQCRAQRPSNAER